MKWGWCMFRPCDTLDFLVWQILGNGAVPHLAWTMDMGGGVAKHLLTMAVPLTLFVCGTAPV